MTIETKAYCDECGKEIPTHGQGCVSILVYATQGFNGIESKFSEDWHATLWKHKESYRATLCFDCVGERVNINHGDDEDFGLKERAISFLKKHGFIKTL